MRADLAQNLTIHATLIGRTINFLNDNFLSREIESWKAGKLESWRAGQVVAPARPSSMWGKVARECVTDEGAALSPLRGLPPCGGRWHA